MLRASRHVTRLPPVLYSRGYKTRLLTSSSLCIASSTNSVSSSRSLQSLTRVIPTVSSVRDQLLSPLSTSPTAFFSTRTANDEYIAPITSKSSIYGHMAPTSEVEDSAEIPSIPPDPPLLHDVYYQLAAHGPAFFFHGADIEVISSPNEFYESLIDMVKTAEKRIVISSLYLGDGPMEMKLTDAIVARLIENKHLCVHFMLDYCRSHRPDKNGSCVDLIRRIVATFPSRVSASFFTPPRITRSMFLPNGSFQVEDSEVHVSMWTRLITRILITLRPKGKISELAAVHHMKAYIVDDRVILSGANLSEIYFTNRHDRYMRFTHPAMCDYIIQIIQLYSVSRHSSLVSCDSIMNSTFYAKVKTIHKEVPWPPEPERPLQKRIVLDESVNSPPSSPSTKAFVELPRVDPLLREDEIQTGIPRYWCENPDFATSASKEKRYPSLRKVFAARPDLLEFSETEAEVIPRGSEATFYALKGLSEPLKPAFGPNERRLRHFFLLNGRNELLYDPVWGEAICGTLVSNLAAMKEFPENWGKNPNLPFPSHVHSKALPGKHGSPAEEIPNVGTTIHFPLSYKRHGLEHEAVTSATDIKADTVIFPLIQLGGMSFRQDELATIQLLRTIARRTSNNKFRFPYLDQASQDPFAHHSPDILQAPQAMLARSTVLKHVRHACRRVVTFFNGDVAAAANAAEDASSPASASTTSSTATENAAAAAATATAEKEARTLQQLREQGFEIREETIDPADGKTIFNYPQSRDAYPKNAFKMPPLPPPNNPVKIWMATGYFNVTERFRIALEEIAKNNTDNQISVIAAHKEANGWYKAKGKQKYVPDLYGILADWFIAKMPKNVSFMEFRRPGWTYHAKGLWLQECDSKKNDSTGTAATSPSSSSSFSPSSSSSSSSSAAAAAAATASSTQPQAEKMLLDPFKPLIAFMGSSNFGERSVNKDSELQVAILTTSHSLITKLDKDLRSSMRYSQQRGTAEATTTPIAAATSSSSSSSSSATAAPVPPQPIHDPESEEAKGLTRLLLKVVAYVFKGFL